MSEWNERLLEQPSPRLEMLERLDDRDYHAHRTRMPIALNTMIAAS
jgi:hypothetical protein